MTEPIGGYFGLELTDSGKQQHTRGLFLNSGRACFEYILRTLKPSKVYLPKYTCDVMLEPLEKLGISYVFYRIDENLELADDIELKPNELLVYTNYFGVKNKYCDSIADKYGDQAILDCSQALFYDPRPTKQVFYSPRKFFGLPDGGILYTSKKLPTKLEASTSYDHAGHLLKRLDAGPEAGYDDFKANDNKLRRQPMAQMSTMTQALWASLDFETAKHKRNENFKFLNDKLGSHNKLSELFDQIDGPLCYPYMTDSKSLRQTLIEAKVYTPFYWPNVKQWCDPEELEYQLAETIIPLPIDQRYDEQDMERIVSLIND